MREYFYLSKKNGCEITCNICGTKEFYNRLRGHHILNERREPELYEPGMENWKRLDIRKDACLDCLLKKGGRV